MKEKTIICTIISILLLICGVPTLIYYGYNVVAILFSVVIGLLEVVVVLLNSIKFRYFVTKKKKAIICANIDNTELVKLYYGSYVSKKIIKKVYEVLKYNFSNCCVKQKFDGKFLILIPYENRNEIVNIIRKTNKELQHSLNDDFFTISVSFGIQICDGNDYDSDENKALIACNDAKKQEMNLFNFYNIKDTEKDLQEKKVLIKLVKALKNNEFEVYFQPKYDYEQNIIVGSEALVRLRQNGEIVPAIEFIEIAEKYGFTVFLDKYVFKETCKKINELKKEKIKFNIISINVSRNTLCEDESIRYYTDTLEKYNISKNEVELEVTERNEKTTSKTAEKIHELSKLFNVSVDDFGVGNSSLSMLMENNIKTIKIDRQFVIDDSKEGRKILDCIIKIIKDLGFNIVAEGVETEEQKNYLKSRGCNIIQGYYFSKPLPFDEFKKILKDKGN